MISLRLGLFVLKRWVYGCGCLVICGVGGIALVGVTFAVVVVLGSFVGSVLGCLGVDLWVLYFVLRD